MPRRSSGFTLIELMIVIAIIAIVATLAVPYLVEARKRANEANAIGALRAIVDAELRYRELHVEPPLSTSPGSPTFAFVADAAGAMPPSFFPPALATAGMLEGFTPDPVSGFFLAKQGYRFFGRPSLVPQSSGYVFFAVAWPVLSNATGDRRYATNQTGVIHVRPDFAGPGLGGIDVSSIDILTGSISSPYVPIGN